jgi:phosphatidate phosphatase LPIN
MDTIARVVSTIQEYYKEINPSTLSGAIDVIVVEQTDGSLHCSPFHVRFGKMHLLRPQEKQVEIKVNDVVVDFAMKVGEAGEAFFVVETKVCIV